MPFQPFQKVGAVFVAQKLHRLILFDLAHFDEILKTEGNEHDAAQIVNIAADLHYFCDMPGAHRIFQLHDRRLFIPRAYRQIFGKRGHFERICKLIALRVLYAQAAQLFRRTRFERNILFAKPSGGVVVIDEILPVFGDVYVALDTETASVARGDECGQGVFALDAGKPPVRDDLRVPFVFDKNRLHILSSVLIFRIACRQKCRVGLPALTGGERGGPSAAKHKNLLRQIKSAHQISARFDLVELKAAKTHTVLYQINRTEYYCQVDLPLSDYPLYGKQKI